MKKKKKKSEIYKLQLVIYLFNNINNLSCKGIQLVLKNNLSREILLEHKFPKYLQPFFFFFSSHSHKFTKSCPGCSQIQYQRDVQIIQVHQVSGKRTKFRKKRETRITFGLHSPDYKFYIVHPLLQLTTMRRNLIDANQRTTFQTNVKMKSFRKLSFYNSKILKSRRYAC